MYSDKTHQHLLLKKSKTNTLRHLRKLRRFKVRFHASTNEMILAAQAFL